MDSEIWMNLAFTWAPVLLMIVFWLYFWRRFGTFRQRGYLDRHVEILERQEQLLERIATALERRNERGQ